MLADKGLKLWHVSASTGLLSRGHNIPKEKCASNMIMHIQCKILWQYRHKRCKMYQLLTVHVPAFKCLSPFFNTITLILLRLHFTFPWLQYLIFWFIHPSGPLMINDPIAISSVGYNANIICFSTAHTCGFSPLIWAIIPSVNIVKT